MMPTPPKRRHQRRDLDHVHGQGKPFRLLKLQLSRPRRQRLPRTNHRLRQGRQKFRNRRTRIHPTRSYKSKLRARRQLTHHRRIGITNPKRQNIRRRRLSQQIRPHRPPILMPIGQTIGQEKHRRPMHRIPLRLQPGNIHPDPIQQLIKRRRIRRQPLSRQHRHPLQQPQVGRLQIRKRGIGKPDHRKPHLRRGKRLPLQRIMQRRQTLIQLTNMAPHRTRLISNEIHQKNRSPRLHNEPPPTRAEWMGQPPAKHHAQPSECTATPAHKGMVEVWCARQSHVRQSARETPSGCAERDQDAAPAIKRDSVLLGFLQRRSVPTAPLLGSGGEGDTPVSVPREPLAVAGLLSAQCHRLVLGFVETGVVLRRRPLTRLGRAHDDSEHIWGRRAGGGRRRNFRCRGGRGRRCLSSRGVRRA